MLARFRFENELGTGASGVVFRGREQGTGRLVAVKLFADASDDDVDAAGVRARHEQPHAPAALLAYHPNITTCLEAGVEGRLRYTVMELVEGGDLGRHTAKPNLLPLARVLSIVSRVADALDHAHAAGVVHGDVKPANILFDAVGDRVKLTDFPLCAASDDGTAAYLSPERLRGAASSAASDQFALGVTLYRLACGQVPFRGRSRAEIAYRVLSAPHSDVRSHGAPVPAAVAAVIDRALSKEPQDRFASAGALSRALSAVQAGLPAATTVGAP